jgi:sulfonate transport system substrate-binding protein
MHQILQAAVTHRRRHRVSAALACLSALLAITASANAIAASESSSSLPEKLAAAVPKGVRLVMAEQGNEASVPWALSGVGKGAPYQVTFANFNGGPDVLQALVAGAVDIGFIGEAPLPIAVGAGVTDLVAVAAIANPGSPANTYVIVQPKSGIKSVEELRGRSVAYPPGTGRHMILAGVLHEHHLNLNTDVRNVQLAGSEVAPTFASGAVDAAVVLGDQYFRLGEPPILANGKGHNWGLEVLVVRKEVLNDPAKAAALADFTRRSVAVYNWEIAHPDAWINATFVKQQGLTFAQGKRLLDETGFGTYYPLTPQLTAAFQEISDGLLETGALKKKIDIAPYVDSRYNDIVQAQNALDGVTPRPLSNGH